MYYQWLFLGFERFILFFELMVCACISSSNCNHNEIKDVPSFVLNVCKKWNIFLDFFLFFFLQKFVIYIDQFYKLYCDVWWWLYQWVIKVVYVVDTEYVWSESCIAVISWGLAYTREEPRWDYIFWRCIVEGIYIH